MKANSEAILGLMWVVTDVGAQDDGSLRPGSPTRVNNTDKRAHRLRREQNPGGGRGDSSVPGYGRRICKSTA